MSRIRLFTATAMIAIAAFPALADTAPPGQATPKACLSGVAPGSVQNGCRTTETPGTSLSSKLSNSNGTIKPPQVDPKMVTPAPNTGAQTMPVIPPPGTPGGNPNVIPK